nr:MAG TPA: hypothetical protein [Caudoviricetes sp.]
MQNRRYTNENYSEYVQQISPHCVTSNAHVLVFELYIL